MNLSIRAKLAGILALQMIAMALLGWQGIVGIRDLKDRVKLIYAGEFLPSRMIATTDSTLVSWNRAILNHILAENMEKMEQYEQIIKRTKETVSGTLGSLLGTVSLSQREKEIVRTIQEELARADPIQNHLL